ncbi:MAG TPA: hypothetical protein VMT27_07770 [Actinomycetes bacterium]|nr:hypothetical protein [Actinomycetes bacterium]
MRCPQCGDEVNHSCPGVCPPEPPIGTWVKDRHGGTSHRGENGSWGSPGMYYLANWERMWQARGPLVECGPWGGPL